MPEVLLMHYRVCVDCMKPAGEVKLTREHALPLVWAAWYPDIMNPLVHTSINHVPICRKDHDRLEDRKQKAYRDKGLVGVVNLLGDGRYPHPTHDPEMKRADRVQFAKLFAHLAENIIRLNGDYRRKDREMYPRVLDRALFYVEKYRIAA